MEYSYLNKKVNSFWVTGFVDGEGCFSVSFNLKQSLILGVEVRPSFSISQSRDKEGLNFNSLKSIQEFFCCCSIKHSKHDNVWVYECRSLEDIRLKIIPHFLEYPLQTRKIVDFSLFKEVVGLVAAKQHLNELGLALIIEKSYAMNVSGKRKFQKEQLISKIIRKKIL